MESNITCLTKINFWQKTSSSAIFYNVDLDLRETYDSKCLSNSGKGGFLCLAAFSGLHVKCITQFGNTLLYYSCNKHNVLFPKFFCALLKLMSSECDLDYWGQCLANKITHFSTVSFFFFLFFSIFISDISWHMTWNIVQLSTLKSNKILVTDVKFQIFDIERVGNCLEKKTLPWD